jgi:hypothetical protein
MAFDYLIIAINDIFIHKIIKQLDLVIGQLKIIIFITISIVNNKVLAALGLGGRLSVVAAGVAGEDFSVVVSRFHIIFLSFFIVSLLYHILLDLSIPYAKIFAKVEEITATAVAPIVSHICNGLAHC